MEVFSAEVFSAIIGMIVAGSAGFYFGRSSSSDTQEKTRLETELSQKKQELEAFQSKVSTHFEKTANLFNQVSDSYQSLYEHMAQSSSQLCASQTFHRLPKSQSKQQVENNTSDKSTASAARKGHQLNELFDADHLYNAHDYRNQEQDSDEFVAEESNSLSAGQSNKVVDIESVKEDKKEAPLDYAIKENGVVNHNSLNRGKANS